MRRVTLRRFLAWWAAYVAIHLALSILVGAYVALGLGWSLETCWPLVLAIPFPFEFFLALAII